jgi:hypothetical protein
MPTVLREGGFEFRIRTNDHTPPHVHVFLGDTEAKIELSPVKIVRVFGMSKQDAKKAKELVEAHQLELLAEWRKYHGDL